MVERSINMTPRSQIRTSAKCSSTGEAHELLQRLSHSKELRFPSTDLTLSPVEDKIISKYNIPASKSYYSGEAQREFQPKLNIPYASDQEKLYHLVYSNFNESYELNKARDTLLNIAARDNSKSVKIKLLSSLKENLIQKIGIIKKMKFGENTPTRIEKKMHSKHESIISILSSQSTTDVVLSKGHQGKILRLLKCEIDNKEKTLVDLKRMRNTVLLEIDDLQSEVQYAKFLLKERKNAVEAANTKISRAMVTLTELSKKGVSSSKIIRRNSPLVDIRQQTHSNQGTPTNNSMNSSFSNQNSNNSFVGGVQNGLNAIMSKLWKVSSINKITEERISDRIFTESDDTAHNEPFEKEK